MKMNFLLLFIFISLFCCKNQGKGIDSITVTQLHSQIEKNKDIQLLDVRTSKEWEAGIIENSMKIDVTGTDFEHRAIQQLDKAKPVYIYCRSGGRSLIASKLLKEKGFKVYNVEGGYRAWKNK